MINEYWYVRKRNKHKILLDRHCKAHCRDTDITLKTIKNIIRYVAVSPHKITYANFPLKAIFNLKGRPWRGGLAYIYIYLLKFTHGHNICEITLPISAVQNSWFFSGAKRWNKAITSSRRCWQFGSPEDLGSLWWREHGYEYGNIGVSKDRGTPKWMVYNRKPY